MTRSRTLAAFWPNSEIRRTTELLESKLGGTHLLQLAVTAERVTASGRVDSDGVQAGAIVLADGPLDSVASLRGHRVTLADLRFTTLERVIHRGHAYGSPALVSLVIGWA